MSSTLTVLIPARGGSKGIKRKNLQLINGTPLVVHAIDTAELLAQSVEIVVTTDDHEIAAVAKAQGCTIADRPPELATDEASVDDVVRWFREDNPDAPLVVLQPTCPEVRATDIRSMIDSADDRAGTTLAIPLPHILWKTPISTYAPRVGQRQDHETDWPRREIGVRYYPPGTSEIHYAHPVDRDIIDIDTWEDLTAVRQRLARKRIVFRYLCEPDVGQGHLMRCLGLAELLQQHQVAFMRKKLGTSRGHLPEQFIRDRGWEIEGAGSSVPSADVIVNDVLDTTTVEIAEQHAARRRIINLEDHGSGAAIADLVVNALYPARQAHNEITGSRYAIFRPEFWERHLVPFKQRTGRVLVTFGGADVSHLTERIVPVLARRFPVDVILPPLQGFPQSFKILEPELASRVRQISKPIMSEELSNATVVVTSAGRTLYEAAVCSTPAVVLAQNTREMTHVHLGPEYGNLFLGLGLAATDDQILQAVEVLMTDEDRWYDFRDRAGASVDGKGGERVANLIDAYARGIE